MMKAAVNCHKEVVKILINAGANVNEMDKVRNQHDVAEEHR